MRNRSLNKVFLALALTLFIVIGLMVRNSSEGILFDNVILEFIHIHSDTNSIVLAIMKFISFIGSELFLFPAVGIGFFYTLRKKRYYISKLLIASSLGCWVLNHILKILFNRTRPLEYFLVEQGGLSYPSGHSMVSMSMYLTFAYLLSRTDLFKHKKKLIYSLAIIDVLLMGISRMYLGVHWPTDIIGGFIMGYVYFQVAVKSIKE